jgi:hypothetical protein
VAEEHDSDRGRTNFSEDLMIVELNDDDIRLLHTVLLQQAQEHLSYADTSEVAERFYKLATAFERPVREFPT